MTSNSKSAQDIFVLNVTNNVKLKLLKKIKKDDIYNIS